MLVSVGQAVRLLGKDGVSISDQMKNGSQACTQILDRRPIGLFDLNLFQMMAFFDNMPARGPDVRDCTVIASKDPTVQNLVAGQARHRQVVSVEGDQICPVIPGDLPGFAAKGLGA